MNTTWLGISISNTISSDTLINDPLINDTIVDTATIKKRATVNTAIQKSFIFHSPIVFTMVLFLAMKAQALPLIDHAGIEASAFALSPAADLFIADLSIADLSVAESFSAAEDRLYFTRDQALGRKASRDLSFKSFVTSLNKTPRIYGKDFLLNLDVFERELIAGISSAAITDSPAAQKDVWMDDVTMTVEAAPASRASIPEPTTLMLVSIGMLGLFLHRRRTNWGDR